MKFGGFSFIKKDLKRLKRIVSLKEDVENHHKIIRGRMMEKPIGWPYNPGIMDYLFEIVIDGTTVYFFKDRQKITNPKSAISNGARIIFGTDRECTNYIPLLVFMANEEDNMYVCEDGKKRPLRKSNFKTIIETKMEYIDPNAGDVIETS